MISTEQAFNPDDFYVDISAAYRIEDPAAEKLAYPDLKHVLGRVASSARAAEEYIADNQHSPNPAVLASVRQVERELADYQLLRTTKNIIDADDETIQRKESEHLTAQWSELFAPPKAKHIGALVNSALILYEQMASENQKAARLILPAYRRLHEHASDMYGPSSNEDSTIDAIQESRGQRQIVSIAAWLKPEIEQHFAPFLDDWPFTTGMFRFSDLAHHLQTVVLPKLRQHNANWQDWRVDNTGNHFGLSINGKHKVIKIGRLRPDEPAYRSKPYVAHELMHAELHNIDGRYSREFEEGFGGFIETAMIGEVPYRLTDRYIDVALALGMHNDGRGMTRRELFKLAAARLALDYPKDYPTNRKAISDATWEHVNRIYASSLGNDMIGVRTKDAIYYPGLLRVTASVGLMRSEGQTAAEAFGLLMSGQMEPASEHSSSRLSSAE